MLSSPNSVRKSSRIGLSAVARGLPILAALALLLSGHKAAAQKPQRTFVLFGTVNVNNPSDAGAAQPAAGAAKQAAATGPLGGTTTADWLQNGGGQPPPDKFRLPAGGQPPVVDGPPPPGMAGLEEGEEEPRIDDHSTLWDRKSPPLSTDCCKGAPSFWYGQLDAFIVKRSLADRSQISANLALAEFDYHTGTKITIGRQADSLEALEFVYTQANNWEARSSVSAAGTLQSGFNQGLGIFNLDDFDNANNHTAIYETNLNSFELNRRRWGWDIISTVIGLRYINLQDELLFTSLPNPPAALGEYNIIAENQLMGFHFGGDMLYPLGPGWNIAAKGKFGAFVNSAKQSTSIINNGANVVANGNENLDWALLAEFGGYTTYRIRPRATLRAGYEFWYLHRVALAPDQFQVNIGPALGSGLVNDGKLFLTALTVGAEFQW